MPKARTQPKGSFTVSPWQKKKPTAKSSSPATSSGAGELYAETFVPLGSAAVNEAATGGADSGGGSKRPRLSGSHPQQQADATQGRDVKVAEHQRPDAAELDPCSEAAPAPQHVPEISGFADIAVMKAADDGLIGHVRDSRGTVVAELRSEVLLRRQECTRDDDWSLHLLRIGLPGATPQHLTVLAERSGEDAIRLRAPPAPHGSEDDVASMLARSEESPAQGVHLQFDCESLWEASSAQAHAIAAGLDLAPNSIAAVNTGRLQLGPCPV